MGQDLKVSFKDAKDNLLGGRGAGFQGRNPLKKMKSISLPCYILICVFGESEQSERDSGRSWGTKI